MQLNPEYAEAQAGLGTLLMSAGRLPQAIPHLELAVRYKPGDARAQANLALALARGWKAQDAIPHAEQAVRLTGGQEPEMLDLLGSLYAEVGRFPEAARTERKALAVATERNKTQLAEAAKAKIGLYEAGRVE